MSSHDGELPIIDSHIHLFPGSELDSISWQGPSHPLHGQYSVDNFKGALGSTPSVAGYVVVENDRNFSLDSGEEGWKGPLLEVEWYRRLALGEPRPGEGHSREDARLALGLVPWAPLPSGPEAVAKYLDRVREVAGPAWSRVKGFRYLLQDKAAGTGLTQEFIDSLKLLGRRGFVFELCVDYHNKGRDQLNDTVALVERAHADVPSEERVVVVLNHLLKPDFTAPFDESNADYQAWKAAITTLGASQHVYMKLSGAMSEMSDGNKSLEPEAMADFLLPWVKVVVEAFGLQRIIFASDWPVCTVGIKDGWTRWQRVVLALCVRLGLGGEEVRSLFAGTARRVYSLSKL